MSDEAGEICGVASGDDDAFGAAQEVVVQMRARVSRAVENVLRAGTTPRHRTLFGLYRIDLGENSLFLDASSHLYKSMCPSVGPSVRNAL